MTEKPDPHEILVLAADRCERECGMTPLAVAVLMMQVAIAAADDWRAENMDVPAALRRLADTVEARTEPPHPPRLN